ncbi:MAG: T9SS type A sorting domain-containing protein [Saprospiraceae bacterium]|nr:T9SS type A sorting domain-containing protein [Saprospiraceae bacterium]
MPNRSHKTEGPCCSGAAPPNKTTPGQCGCGNAETDSDCDGIADCNDVCPGGDDAVDSNGDNIPDCSQLLNYNSYSNAWKCGKDKILVCHNGNNPHSICINKNALSAHFNHGDNIGPCTSCGNAIKVQDHYEDVEGDHDHALEDVDFQTMKIVPNPASDDAEIWLEGLNAPGIITLLDLNGKVHWQTKFAAGQNIIKLDDKLVDRVSGTYLIRLVSGNKIITKYIVIIK